ncbi:helix-hairpin-helix domain-containing protein [Pantanalinema sp. GBBB05]|uniref:helix-hairpin-helix domain-containing protein n=1 Tax=Pantanalinema sp. GBBB05 TaxID=2604139 RepID=UPI001DA1700C|nr:ComEA family DNA-binding protein [Pantanalinema sp. GBBB05]
MVLPNWLSAVTQPRSGISSAVRQKILHDPYYRFQSIAEVQLAASLGIQIDVNQATVDDWLRLPGLSIHQARSLVELSRSGVSFHCLEDIAAALGLPALRLKPLEPALRFCYYDPESTCAIQPINPNTASVEMLVQIPGVDLYLAKAIVQHRKQGAYRNLSHLQRRLALPGQMTAELMHYLRF